MGLVLALAVYPAACKLYNLTCPLKQGQRWRSLFRSRGRSKRRLHHSNLSTGSDPNGRFGATAPRVLSRHSTGSAEGRAQAAVSEAGQREVDSPQEDYSLPLLWLLDAQSMSRPPPICGSDFWLTSTCPSLEESSCTA